MSITIPKNSLLYLLNSCGLEPSHMRLVHHLSGHYYQWVHRALSDRFCVFTSCSQLSGHFTHSLTTAGVSDMGLFLFPDAHSNFKQFIRKPDFKTLSANFKALRNLYAGVVADDDESQLAHFRRIVLFIIRCQYFFGTGDDGFGHHSIFEALFGRAHDDVVRFGYELPLQ